MSLYLCEDQTQMNVVTNILHSDVDIKLQFMQGYYIN